jgi:hypothetical protein
MVFLEDKTRNLFEVNMRKEDALKYILVVLG